MEVLTIYQRGMAEQQAAFPRTSFLFQFIWEWNNVANRQAPNFVERQLQFMQRFDRSGLLPSAEALGPQAPRLPSPPAAGPSKQRIIAGPSKPKLTPPQPSPPPPTQPKPTKPKLTQVEHPRIRIVPGPLNPNVTAPAQIRPITPPPPASTAPASLPSAPVPKRKGPPGLQAEELPKTRKFHKIADDSDEEEEEDDEEEEEDVLPTPRLDRKVINHPPCGRCQKARRACEMSPNGGSCLPCKARKYKCDYAKSEPRGAKRGRITKEEYDSILDIDKQFARLEAQVADLTEGSKEMVRMNAHLAGLETDVHQFTGALEGFLGRIRIDNGLRLVSDNRRIGSVNPAHFTLDFDRDLTDGNAINMDSTVSEPDPLGSDLMVISEDDEAPSDLRTFVTGTASTPSDTVGDIRTDMPVRQPRPPSESGNPPSPPPTLASGARPSPQAAGSRSLPLPSLIPPPTINLIPVTPQTSQEEADQLVVPPVDPTPTRPAEPEPTQEPSREPSRTPVATFKSRSKTPL
jgi:hypothetical protein